MIDFVGKKRWFFLASAIVTLVGIVCLAVFGLKLGTDFAGHTRSCLVSWARRCV